MRPSKLSQVRRDAARVLASVLQGDATRQASASIKSLVYASSVGSKQATLALTCHTLKYLPLLKKIVAATDLVALKKGRTGLELVYVLLYEFLFGEKLGETGKVENLLLSRKNAIRAALARLLAESNVTKAEDLLPADVPPFPRYARVNTLKRQVDEVLQIFQKDYPTAERDDLLSDLLVLPAGTDLHDHPLVKEGCVLLQGKSSCMPAQALAPEADWEVLDACAAPGNKTAHLAALMRGGGSIIACELNKNRMLRLQETLKLAGATNVEVLHQDFLKIVVNSSRFSSVRGVLLDPSCSGSGTAATRLDHLLPSSTTGENDDDKYRVEQLARFQEAALRHALSFPRVERVVYSTCSVNQRENEDVISAVLEFATTRGFQLSTAFPTWPHRGLPVLQGADHLLRTDAKRDKMDGFFLALFTRIPPEDVKNDESSSKNDSNTLQTAAHSGPAGRKKKRKSGSKRKRKEGGGSCKKRK